MRSPSADEPSTLGNKLARLVQEHLALAITGAVFVTIGLRVLAASRGNVSTALSLLQNADPVEVVVGMGIQLLPWIPLLVASVLVYMRDTSTEAIDTNRPALGFGYRAGGVALIISSLLGPFHWIYVVGLVVGALAILTGWALSRGSTLFGDRGNRSHHWSRSALLALTAIVYLFLALSPTMWLPRERIMHGDGKGTVGYVLKSDFVATVVLTSRTRDVKHILTRTLDGREICVLEDPKRPLLFRLFGGAQPEYPRCRKA